MGSETTTDRTRAEHLQWCKDRAIEILDSGDRTQAFASMGSDLNKHDETRGHPAMETGMMMLMSDNLDSPEQVRQFILGFH